MVSPVFICLCGGTGYTAVLKTVGLKGLAGSEPWKKVCTSQDFTIAILDYLGGRSGITGEFRYATLGIQILAGIIERATGEKCIGFANRNLFEPLGLPKRIPHGDSSKEESGDRFFSFAIF